MADDTVDANGVVSAQVVEVMGTVTQPYPIMVVADGSTVSCPALVQGFESLHPGIGKRVNLRLRNPLMPLVLGYSLDGSDVP